MEANGIEWEFPAAEVNAFFFDGAGDHDEIETHDSSGNDALEAAGDTLNLAGPDYRVEAIAFELARAISESGGDDTEKQDAIDFVLELEGVWRELTP